MDRLVSSREVSELTTVPEGTLGWLRHRGAGPRFFKLGRRVVYKQADVEEWLEEQFINSKGAESSEP